MRETPKYHLLEQTLSYNEMNIWGFELFVRQNKTFEAGLWLTI